MKKTNLNKLLCASILSLCTVNVLFAQSTKTDFTQEVTSYEESAYGELKGYVATKSATGSKMDVDIKEIPQSVSVVTQDMMRIRNVHTIQGATSYTSAITQPYGEARDTRTNYGNIRGMGSIYRSSFLDGLKLLHSGHLIPTISPYALERVEVLKGPSSVLYGASGPGGLLNLQSKKANDTDSAEIGVSYETFNTRSVFSDINKRINDKVSIRLIGKYKKGDAALKESTNSSYFFNPSLSYSINDTSSLDLYTSFSKDQIKGLGLNFAGGKSTYNIHNSIALNAAAVKAYITTLNPAFAGVPTAAWIQAIENSADEVNALNLPSDLLIGAKDKEIFEKENKSITAVFNKTFSDSLSLKSSLRAKKMNGIYDYSQPDSTALITAIANFTPDLTKVQFELIKSKATMKSIASDTNLQYKWNTKNIQNTSLIGLDLQYSKFTTTAEKSDAFTYDLKNRKISSYTTNTGKTKDQTISITQLGLYAQNTAKIDDKYIVSTSLRYDKLKEKEDEKVAATSYTKNDSNVSGRVGLVYLLNEELAPYITYSTSFAANSGKDKSGKQFVPSIGKQYEIGLKYKPKNMNAFFTLAAYHLENNDVVTPDLDPSYSVQEKDIEIKGLEFDITANPIENLNVIASFTRMKGKSKNTPDPKYDGYNLSDIPKFTASLWSDYTFKKTLIGNLTLGAGIKYTGASDYIRPDHLDLPNRAQKVYKNKAYSVVDTLISTQYNNWNIALNINNILDKKAIIANASVQGGETQGRTYALTASYKF